MMRHVTQRRRHFLAAALIISALVVWLPAGPAGAATPNTASPTMERHLAERICDYNWRKGARQVKRTIRCATRRWHVSGGARKALYIARRESNFQPHAYNPSGCAGIYQQQKAYWPGRARTFGMPGESVFNARANIIVSIRMVHQSGWGPWS